MERNTIASIKFDEDAREKAIQSRKEIIDKYIYNKNKYYREVITIYG